MTDIMRICTKCGEAKPPSEYYRDSGRTDGLYLWCKVCALAATTAWNHANPERAAKTRRAWIDANPDRWFELNVLKYYRMTLKHYVALLKLQKGVCAICHNKCRPPKRLSVDHDHKCCPDDGSCGKCVRGLLCRACNQGLGQFDDSIERLRSAIDYLEQTRQRSATGWTVADLDETPWTPNKPGRPGRSFRNTIPRTKAGFKDIA